MTCRTEMLECGCAARSGAERRPAFPDCRRRHVAGAFQAWRLIRSKAQAWTTRASARLRQVCHWLLTSRLQFFEDRKRYPIARRKNRKAAVRDRRAALRHDAAACAARRSIRTRARCASGKSCIPRRRRDWRKADDPRRARADADWREILERLPKWLISHPYNDMLGDGLPECERTWAFDFRVMTPTAWWRVPMGMIIGGLPSDPQAQYRLHKMMLQQCQYARPKKYWVLKGFHGQRLAKPVRTYPDAHIIWVHRDPVQAIASRIVLTGELVEGLTGTRGLEGAS